MAAFGYYTNATRYIMGSHDVNENYLVLLQEALAPLRFYLSCRVCNKILQQPMTPDHTACQHTVCLQCIGGKMRLKPVCGWCKNYENFVENKSLTTLIKCYAKLCQYVACSSDHRKQLEFAGKCMNSALGNSKEKVAALLKEGCQAVSADNINVNNAEAKSIADHKNDNRATRVLSNNSSDSRTTQMSKGDLRLKLIIPSGKKRRWYTSSIQAQSSKMTKKKGNTLVKSQQQVVVSSDVPVNEPLTSQSTDPPSIVAVNAGKANEMQKSLESASSEAKEDSILRNVRKVDSATSERKRCGCGSNATSAPGKLTCYGQRCPCYSSHIPCLGCKCKGCRNPNKIVKIEQASEDTDGDEINVE